MKKTFTVLLIVLFASTAFASDSQDTHSQSVQRLKAVITFRAMQAIEEVHGEQQAGEWQLLEIHNFDKLLPDCNGNRGLKNVRLSVHMIITDHSGVFRAAGWETDIGYVVCEEMLPNSMVFEFKEKKTRPITIK